MNPYLSYLKLTQQTQQKPRRSGRRTALTVLAATLSLASAPALALAAPATIPSLAVGALTRAGVPGVSTGLASPYGEAQRFGGFDETFTKPGEFYAPVGFSVDPHNEEASTPDHNAVYVLDRGPLDGLEEGKLSYRLQKLSSSGTVLGSVTIPESFSDTTSYSDANPLISLAIDSAKHRVYALVEGLVNSGEGKYVPVAQRLVAWSTVPNASKELVPAGGYPVDSLTGAGLVAGQSALEPASIGEDLYAPEGITVDPADHDVVIEAQRGVKEGPSGGPTVLQRVSTEGSNSGKLDGEWVAKAPIAPNNEQADGVFTATNGSFGIDLYKGWGDISGLAEVKPSFATPEAALIAAGSTAANLDEAPTIDNPATINNNSNHGGQWETADFETTAAGSPITQLTNNLYAARYGEPGAGVIDGQSQVSPWNGLPYFWNQNGFEEVGNMGVRLFSSTGAVVTTIGGQASGQACNLDYAQLAVAAGANGSLFVLTQPNTFFNPLTEINRSSDDQVIELTPGGTGACPQPSASLTLNGASGSSFSFPVGTNVTFADSVERKGEAPYRFDWVLLNASSLSVEDLKTQIEAPGYKWPAPSTSHTFTQKGTYYAAATVYGDYGLTYITTVTITIH